MRLCAHMSSVDELIVGVEVPPSMKSGYGAEGISNTATPAPRPRPLLQLLARPDAF